MDSNISMNYKRESSAQLYKKNNEDKLKNQQSIRDENNDQIFQLEQQKYNNFTNSQNKYQILLAEIREKCSIFLVDNNNQQKQILRYRENDEKITDYTLQDSKESTAGMLVNMTGLKNVFKSGNDDSKMQSIRKIYMDQIGYHCIICTDKGDNYYFNLNQTKIKQLKIKEQITALAFNEQIPPSSENTGQILIATFDQKIIALQIEFKSKNDEIFESSKILYTMKQNNEEIRHLFFFQMNKQDSKNNEQISVIIALNKNKMYYFHGPAGGDFEIIFSSYRNRQKNESEADEVKFPDNPDFKKQSLCHFYLSDQNKSNTYLAHSLFWTNGNNLDLYKIPNYFDKNMFNSFKTINYAKKKEETSDIKVTQMPIAIAVTDLHYYILHEDCLTIMSLITEKIVKVYDQFQTENAIYMNYNHLQKEFKIVTRNNVYRLRITNEDHNAWKLYIQQKKLEEAYQICLKYNSNMTMYVCSLYANEMLLSNDQKDPQKIAQIFYQSNKSFEEVVLKLQNYKNQQALISYLELWIDVKTFQQDPNIKTETVPAHQKVLINYLTELKLYQLNKIQSEIDFISVSQEKQSKNIKNNKENLYQKTKKDFIEFLEKYQKYLDKETTQQLLVSHGRIEECLEFFTIIQDYGSMIKHFINEEKYKEAINILHNISDKKQLTRNRNDILKQYMNIFMKNETEEITNYIMGHFTNSDDNFNADFFDYIIPFILDIPKEKDEIAIKFVKFLIENNKKTDKNKSTFNNNNTSLYNVYIYFLSESKNQNCNKYLEEFLNQQQQNQMKHEQKIMFDLDFAMKMFKKNNKIKEQIQIYGLMGQYAESVKKALEQGYIEIAENYSLKPVNEDEKKKLLLEIAKYQFENNQDVKTIINFIKKHKKYLQIQDMLPHFNENIEIQQFKEQLCESLDNYNDQIENLQHEMEEYSQNVEQQLNELRSINNKYYIIQSQKNCDRCKESIFNDEQPYVYVFPCSHAFHKKCIIAKFQEHPELKLQLPTIKDLERKIKISHENQRNQKTNSDKSANNSNILSFLVFNKNPNQISQNHTQDFKELESLQQKLNEILAFECLDCGISIVDLIDEQLGSAESRQSWSLTE